MYPVDLATFLVIAEIHSGIDASRLARMDRVVQLAGSALAAPFAGYGEVELYPSLADKAAIYASRIMRNHPLPDGNKRTAYDVMVEFIERNGPRVHTPLGGPHGDGRDDRAPRGSDRQRGRVPSLGRRSDR